MKRKLTLFLYSIGIIFLVTIITVIKYTDSTLDTLKTNDVQDTKEYDNANNVIFVDDYKYYEILGKAEIDENFPKDYKLDEWGGFIKYEPLDKLNRPTGVKAKITSDKYNKIEKKKPRQEIKIDPTGWTKNRKVEFKTKDNKFSYNGYMLNRSHLLADSLGGNPVLENLITATRLQNVGFNKKGHEGGMGYGEELARSWLSKNKGFIYYNVDCHYPSDNTLYSDYQIVNIKSSDNEIDLKIKVKNDVKMLLK